MLGASRMLGLAVAAGVLVGVRVQPRFAGVLERVERPGEAAPAAPAVQAADVL
jgi:hypothetical protein